MTGFNHGNANESYTNCVVRATLWGAVFGIVMFDSPPSHSACIADDTVKSKQEVVFSSEVAGKPIDRREALGEALKQDNTVAQEDLQARWQSGYFWDGSSWRSAEALEEQNHEVQLAGYEKQRGAGDLDLESQRRLARWCKSEGLQEKAKAHWFGVLELDPTDVEARKELGFVYVFGRWISPNEMSLAKLKSKSVSESLKQWMPKVREWVAAMEGSDTKKRLRAIAQLKEVKDPGVIVALDIAIGQVSVDTAQHFIRAIHRFQTQEACLALSGIALVQPSSEVGMSALEALKDYPLSFYVPDLLDLMCTEFELKNQVVTRSNGELVLQLVQMREWRDKIEQGQLDKILVVSQKGGVKPFNGLAVERIGRGLVQFHAYRSSNGVVYNEVASSIAAKEAQRDAAAANANIQKSNEAIRKFQSDIATVLRGTTGVKLDDAPKSWWDWWDRYEESYSSGEKLVDSRYAEDRSSVAYAPEQVKTVSEYPPLVPRRHECLVLGTQITTESGLKSIENIRVGDQVLSQSIVSGQLRLKPVLRTTIRPAAATKEFALSSGETIRSTLGHPWWVVGKGWVKTKELKEGMSLRTTSGYSTIKSLKDSEAIETFNLVVDEDHTYFVGQSRVLAYDATELSPTFQRLPGLPAEVLRGE